MDETVFNLWKTISNVKISNNGDWVCYNVGPEVGDTKLHIYNSRTQKDTIIDRADKVSFDANNNFIAFRIKPHFDSIKQKKLEKVKKDKMPKDSLGILVFDELQLDKIPNVQSFKLPEEEGGVLAYKKHKRSMKKDSTLIKKENSENGTLLCIRDFTNDSTFHYPYVKDYLWSKKNLQLLMHGSGQDSIQNNSVTLYNGKRSSDTILFQQKGKYSRFSFNEDGSQLTFIADRDSTKNQIRPYELMYWEKSGKGVQVLCDTSSNFIPEGWQISKNYTTLFSKNENRFYFGIAPFPFIKDTSVLDDDKANVEVWNYKDGLLQTQQNVRKKRDQEKSYLVSYDYEKNSFIRLNNSKIPDIRISDKLKGNKILMYSDLPYQKTISWLGYAHKDLYLLDLDSGKRELIGQEIHGTPRMSPSENFVYWFSRQDTSWMCYHIESSTTNTLTKGAFFNELHDQSSFPRESGSLGWTENDDYIILYDHYDIWRIDPLLKEQARNITNGRKDRIKYRHVGLNRDLQYFPNDTTVLLKVFDEKDKSSGYAFLNIGTGEISRIEKGPYNYTTRITKAKKSDDIIFTKSSFVQFPDLIHSNINFENQTTISNANPQQSDYAWGSIELINWTDGNGEVVEGLLVKPEGFDPSKKYPMIVNFYERSSHGLHNHRAPYPHRSTINYSYYANQGYLIFNPDVKYSIGYPGRSCYEAIVSGTKAIIEKGFVDEKKNRTSRTQLGRISDCSFIDQNKHVRLCRSRGSCSQYGICLWWNQMGQWTVKNVSI